MCNLSKVKDALSGEVSSKFGLEGSCLWLQKRKEIDDEGLKVILFMYGPSTFALIGA